MLLRPGRFMIPLLELEIWIQFVRDNNCTIEFDAFGFSVKDFMTCRVLLRCDSTRDLYPVTAPSPSPHFFLVSQHTWHQRLGHPRSEVLRRLVSNNSITCNKEKLSHPHNRTGSGIVALGCNFIAQQTRYRKRP
ncbi:ribonuclease H-like domain-containing protein [Tanacetum coccineum]